MHANQSLVEVETVLRGCSNQFGPLERSSGSRATFDAIAAFVYAPTPARWERARWFFVSWEGERFTLNRAVTVFAGVLPDEVPTAQQTMWALQAVSG